MLEILPWGTHRGAPAYTLGYPTQGGGIRDTRFSPVLTYSEARWLLWNEAYLESKHVPRH